jgi:ribosomal protein S18 acetylase RimI-like enzyme
MEEAEADTRIRPVDDLDLDAIITIDEKIGGEYRPDHWERRITYYLRRDPDASLVAEVDGEVVGFMLGEVRAGEFGLDAATGWIEVLGVDPDFRGQALGRRLAERMLQHFKSKDAQHVRTLVHQDREDLASFFQALGFEPDPLRPFVKAL